MSEVNSATGKDVVNVDPESSEGGLGVEDAIAQMKAMAAEQRYFDVNKMGIERDMATSQAMANTANKASDRMAQK